MDRRLIMKNTNIVQIYGKHAVLAALQNTARKHVKLTTTNDLYEKYYDQIARYKLKVELKTEREINSLYPEAVHQGLILHTSSVFLYGIESINKITSKNHSCIFMLDQITDPQNIGAIIRSALAFGVDAIIIPEHNSPNETPSLAKASSGAIEQVPIIKVTNLVNTINYLKKQNYWVTGLDSNSDKYIDKSAMSNKTVFILGAEGKGLRKLTLENCDFIVKIMMSDKIDSINVSNAAAITMYEYYKQLV